MRDGFPDLDIVINLLEWIFQAETSPEERESLKHAVVSGWGNKDTSEEVLVWHLLAYHSNLIELTAQEQEERRGMLAANLELVAKRGADGDAGRIWDLVLRIFTGRSKQNVDGPVNRDVEPAGQPAPGFGGWLNGLLDVALQAFQESAANRMEQAPAASPSLMDGLVEAAEEETRAIEELRKTDPVAAAIRQQVRMQNMKTFVSNYMEIQRSMSLSKLQV